MPASTQHSASAPAGGVRAPTGTSLTCRSWPQEAAFRMLQNNLDTHEWAPRVLIANSNLVPDWGTWDEFRRLEHLGLTMFGQMTAGSWIYIGTQGILQGTYECFGAIARKRFGGSLAGTLTVTAGLGGMGGAQPLAITMNEGVALCIEVDPERAARRVETRYLDVVADDYADALRRCEEAVRARRPLSVGLGGNAADLMPHLRAEAQLGGYERAFDYPGFLPAYIRPLFCEGKGPFRWVALSGDPADIAATDRAVLEEFPDDEPLKRWITLAGERVAFQGLPERICWLGYGERHRLGLRFNELVRSGEIKAPIVIGRDHLDSGSAASPYRETEDMADGSDAIADWPLLNDPGTGVMRHADAGYDRAWEVAAERGVQIPADRPAVP